MTTLDNGVVIDESINAVHFTTPADCLLPEVFNHERVIESFTIHHWGALGQDFDTVENYLASDNERQSSAHFVAMEGKVSCLVTPQNAAWHAGSAIGNATSVGIECHPEAKDDDYSTVASLIRYLRTTYGDFPLVPHNHWIGTDCPGVWDLVRLDKLARQGTVATTPAPAPVVVVPMPDPAVTRPGFDPAKDIHWHVEANDTLGKIQAYYNGPSVEQIAAYNGISNPNFIAVGSDIFIPGPLVWNIEAPDTIRSIAAYYGLDPDYLAHKNGLPSADSVIYIGNVLRIL